MQEVRRILAAIDDSDWSAPVLRVSGAVARRFGADLTVVHAESIEAPTYFTESAVSALAEVLAGQRRAAEAWLRDTAALQLGNTPFDTRLADGAPTEAVLAAARQLDTDLVVLGTHGRSGLNRLLLGSVAERVLRVCDRPVLTVRAPMGHRPWEHGPQRILCPVNFTDVSQHALDWAQTLAARFEAELVLLTAVEDGDADAARASMAASCEATACRTRGVVREGEAASQILQAVDEEAADMIVIGARHRPFLETTILGTTSVRVGRHAPCPVLTIRAGSQSL